VPPGFEFFEQQLLLWLLAMIRPGAAFVVAPVFGARSVPVQVRLIIALAIGIPGAAASNMVLPLNGMVSVSGIMMIMSEILLGLALGFAVQIGFAAAMLAGELISNTIGLGFASMNNPMSGQHSSAIGQFLNMVATFLFLATDGHLALVAIIIDSYIAMPPGNAWLSNAVLDGIVQFGSLIFAAGLSIALPVGFAMILVQIVMAVIARSTPSLNLFAVGLPATLLAGIILLASALPVMADSLIDAVTSGAEQSAIIGKG
jgi:flagellar biosynthesis protein FliR